MRQQVGMRFTFIHVAKHIYLTSGQKTNKRTRRRHTCNCLKRVNISTHMHSSCNARSILLNLKTMYCKRNAIHHSQHVPLRRQSRQAHRCMTHAHHQACLCEGHAEAFSRCVALGQRSRPHLPSRHFSICRRGCGSNLRPLQLQ